jgi:hypothetical protein
MELQNKLTQRVVAQKLVHKAKVRAKIQQQNKRI